MDGRGAPVRLEPGDGARQVMAVYYEDQQEYEAEVRPPVTLKFASPVKLKFAGRSTTRAFISARRHWS
jgi:hypothetical protein